MRTLIAAVAVAAAVLSTAAGGASGATTCQNLPIPKTLHTLLAEAHGTAANDGPIAKGSIYYGRCGSTRYAIATFSKALADQPEKFRKLAGRALGRQGRRLRERLRRGRAPPDPEGARRSCGMSATTSSTATSEG